MRKVLPRVALQRPPAAGEVYCRKISFESQRKHAFRKVGDVRDSQQAGARLRGRQNPAEAINLLLTQNFLPVLAESELNGAY